MQFQIKKEREVRKTETYYEEMNLTGLIDYLGESGENLLLGRHTEGLYGYFARIYNKGARPDMLWSTAGHGLSLVEAIKDALWMRDRKQPTVYTVNQFLKGVPCTK